MRVDDQRSCAALIEQALLWIERTPLLGADASLQALRPEALLAVESLVEEFVSLASAQLRPTHDACTVSVQICTDLTEFVRTAQDVSGPRALLASLVAACTALRKLLTESLSESELETLCERLDQLTEQSAFVALLGDHVVPAFVIALYHALWPKLYAERPSPFGPLLGVWQLGAWPVLRSDEQAVVYIWRGEKQDILNNSADVWAPVIASGLTAATSLRTRRMYTLQVFERDVLKQTVLISGEVTVGRAQSNDLALVRGNVSSKHARLVEQEDGWWVADLKSTNGTYVDELRVRVTEPVQGRVVRLGNFSLHFSATSALVNQWRVLFGLVNVVGLQALSRATQSAGYLVAAYKLASRDALPATLRDVRWLEPSEEVLRAPRALIGPALKQLNLALRECSAFARTLERPVINDEQIELFDDFVLARQEWIKRWKVAARREFSPTVGRIAFALNQLFVQDSLAYDHVGRASPRFVALAKPLIRDWPKRASALGRTEGSLAIGHYLTTLQDGVAEPEVRQARLEAFEAIALLWSYGLVPLWMPDGAAAFYLSRNSASPTPSSETVAADADNTDEIYNSSILLPGSDWLSMPSTELCAGPADDTRAEGALESLGVFARLTDAKTLLARPVAGATRVVTEVADSWTLDAQIITKHGHHWIELMRANALHSVNRSAVPVRPLVHGDLLLFGYSGAPDSSQYRYRCDR
jgi:hypothetical protein